MSGSSPRSASTESCPDRSDETTAQHGAGTQVAARSTTSSAIFAGSRVVLTARTMSSSASRRSTRLRIARWKTRRRVDRSRPGVVREISDARRSFDPVLPAGPAAWNTATGARPEPAARRRPGVTLVARPAEGIRRGVWRRPDAKFFCTQQIYHRAGRNPLATLQLPDIRSTFPRFPMTMLDRMRRHRNWLKWSLALVCLAFVIFYIPDFLRSSGANAAAGDTVAVIEGREIHAEEFRRTYQAQLQAYRSAYGGNMSEQLLKQLGIEQQILQQMVDEQASVAEARRVGIEVSDEEVRQRIFAIPAFQDNGHFIGDQRYQQLLRQQRPPLTPADFEDGIRRSLTVEKLRASLTDWLSVPDKELEQEYRRRNDKVKLAVVSFLADSFRTQATVTDQEVASYFGAHAADFKVPEKRKIKFMIVDIDAIRAKVT